MTSIREEWTLRTIPPCERAAEEKPRKKMTSASGAGTQVFVESWKLAKTNSKSKIGADGGHREKSLPYDTMKHDELPARKSKLDH